MPTFLTQYPPVISHPHTAKVKAEVSKGHLPHDDMFSLTCSTKPPITLEKLQCFTITQLYFIKLNLEYELFNNYFLTLLVFIIQ